MPPPKCNICAENFDADTRFPMFLPCGRSLCHACVLRYLEDPSQRCFGCAGNHPDLTEDRLQRNYDLLAASLPPDPDMNIPPSARQELKDLENNPPCQCSIGVINNDPFNCRATLIGPSNSPYQGGLFKLKINFPDDYPFKPPQVRFETKVYHPNINEQGGICLDIIQRKWCPSLSISAVLLTICAMLAEPNATHYLRWDIADLYRNDRKKYDDEARRWTRLYATG